MNEGQIREALIAKVASSAVGHGAAFISEMFVDEFSRRADLVVANGKLAVFEIKSHQDSLDRLTGQVASYCRFFEQVTVVCASKHLHAVETTVPGAVGIWSVSDAGVLKVVRSAKSVPQVEVKTWLSFLPVDEIRALLRERGYAAVGRRDDLVRIASGVPLRVVRGYVLDFLKRRDTRIAERVRRRAVKPSAVVAASPEVQLQRFLEEVRPEQSLIAIPRRIPHSSKNSSSLASSSSEGSPEACAR